MEKNTEELKKYIECDQSYILCQICNNFKKKRIKNENKILSNKERPSWNNNSIKVLEKDCDPLVKEDCECEIEKISKEIFENMVADIKNIKSIETLNSFSNQYSKYLGELINTKVDLIRSDFVFKKWNVSINTVLAANRFKSALSRK